MSIKKEITTGALSLVALAAGADAVMAQDWTGYYAGLSLTTNNGRTPWNAGSSYDDYQLGNAGVAGAFIGHRWSAGSAGSAGSVVIGAELDVSMAGLEADATNVGGDYSMGTSVDSKLSVGVPMGKALIYGFAGISASTVSAEGSDYGVWGTNIGLGIDYMVTDKFSVGGEVMSRAFQHGYSGGGSNSMASTSVSLRGTFHF